MSTDKTNMSLDDIIKLSKADQARKKGPARTGNRTFPKRTVVASRAKGGNVGKKAPIRRSALQNKVAGRVGANRPGNAPITSASNLSIMKKLVNNAVKRRLAQDRIRNPAGNGTGLGGRTVPRNIVTNSARLAALNQQSRVIRKPIQRLAPVRQFRAPAPVQQQPIVIREVIQPVQVVERVQQAAPQRFAGGFRNRPAPIRQVIQRVGGGGIVRRAPIVQQRFISQPVIQRQQVIQQRIAPRVQQVIRRPVQQQQVVVRRVPQRNVEYVQYVDNARPAFGNAARVKNDAMRDALGLGGGRARQQFQPVQRFQSGSFVTQRSVVRRGRGFNNF